jgi:hypothetical protein
MTAGFSMKAVEPEMMQPQPLLVLDHVLCVPPSILLSLSDPQIAPHAKLRNLRLLFEPKRQNEILALMKSNPFLLSRTDMKYINPSVQACIDRPRPQYYPSRPCSPPLFPRLRRRTARAGVDSMTEVARLLPEVDMDAAEDMHICHMAVIEVDGWSGSLPTILSILLELTYTL